MCLLGSNVAIASPPVCLEANKDYKVKLNFQRYKNQTVTPSASILVDSVSALEQEFYKHNFILYIILVYYELSFRKKNRG